MRNAARFEWKAGRRACVLWGEIHGFEEHHVARVGLVCCRDWLVECDVSFLWGKIMGCTSSNEFVAVFGNAEFT